MISVITAAYNEEKYIGQCLDSLLNQTYRDLEVIVVDDGSTDGTWDIIQRYAARDSRIKAIHQENQGPAAARNTALDAMTGEYFTCIDADDWLELACLEQAYQAAVQNDADMVMWGYQKEFPEGIAKPQKAHQLAPGLYDGEDCRQVVLDSIHRRGRQIDGSLWTRFIRASIVKIHGLRFDPSFHYYEDCLFLWELHPYCSRIFSMCDRLYLHYRQHQTSAIHTYSPDYFDTVLRLFDKLQEFFVNNDLYTKEIQTRVNWSRLYLITKAVKQEKFCGGTQEEMTKAVDAILLDPRVRNAVAQVDSKTGTELFGQRYELMRDKRSWELLNAEHL